MTKLQQYTFVCAPSPLQYAALKALDVRHEAAPSTPIASKRDLVYRCCRRSSRSSSPAARSTSSPRPRKGITATDFVAKAIENNVLIIPGNVFSERDTHFRISYATSDEKLVKGCEILNSLA